MTGRGEVASEKGRSRCDVGAETRANVMNAIQHVTKTAIPLSPLCVHGLGKAGSGNGMLHDRTKLAPTDFDLRPNSHTQPRSVV